MPAVIVRVVVADVVAELEKTVPALLKSRLANVVVEMVTAASLATPVHVTVELEPLIHAPKIAVVVPPMVREPLLVKVVEAIVSIVEVLVVPVRVKETPLSMTNLALFINFNVPVDVPVVVEVIIVLTTPEVLANLLSTRSWPRPLP